LLFKKGTRGVKNSICQWFVSVDSVFQVISVITPPVFTQKLG